MGPTPGAPTIMVISIMVINIMVINICPLKKKETRELGSVPTPWVLHPYGVASMRR
jgi:hypothetical protein